MSSPEDRVDAPNGPGITMERDGHIAVMTLNRPHVGNALNAAMRDEIRGMWKTVKDDHRIRVVIVTGAGDRHFCTGADLAEVATAGAPSTGMGRAVDEIAWSPLINGVWKPVICALNGVVAGGGLHFVADADIVLAAPHVEIMDTHTSVGMVGSVENVGLAHRMPLGSALRLSLMGRSYRMPAERAHTLGLVDEIVPAERLLEEAADIAEKIAENSPRAVSLSKQAIWESIGRSREDAAEYAWALARLHRSHPDVAEGARAFVERRPARWSDS